MEQQRRLALTILAAVCLTYYVENFLRSAASALTPVLITELGISRGAMGFLITGYFLIYGIMQFPSGVLADVLGPRKAILWFTGLTCAGGALFWLSYRYELLLAAQMIMGVGTSVFYINAVTVIARWFPPERKATAISVLSAASGVGAFTSYMGFPLAASIWGSWRDLYLVMLAVLVLNWVLNIFVLKDSPVPVTLVKRTTKDVIASFKETLADGRFQPMLVAYTLLAFNYVILSWGTQFLMEAKGLTYVEGGLVTSLGTIAGIPGCIIMGAVSDRLRKRKLPLMIFSCLYTIIVTTFIFAPAGLPLPLLMALSFGINFCGSMWVLFFSMVPEVLPPEKASIGLGLVNGLGTIGYSIITPFYGSLIDITGNYFASNMVMILSALVMTATMILFTKETYGGLNKAN